MCISLCERHVRDNMHDDKHSAFTHEIFCCHLSAFPLSSHETLGTFSEALRDTFMRFYFNDGEALKQFVWGTFEAGNV